MKRLSIYVLIAMLLPMGLLAQEIEENTFTDEELTKYATVMKWAKEQQSSLSSRVSDSLSIWIGEFEGFTPAIYNQLNKAENLDEVADVSDDLKTAFQDIQARLETKKQDLTSSFKETYVTKIKEDIGAGLYNRLKKAMKADVELKERYEQVLASLDESETTETAEDSSESN